MTSLWLQNAPVIETDDFDAGAEYDEVVVGGGLTGLVTALLFARAGRRVAVLEARRIGAGSTGNTTAKLSLLQGAHLSRIAAYSLPSVLEAYVQGNLEGQAWLLRYLQEHGVPFQMRDAVSYATTDRGRQTVAAEYDAASRAGLPVRLEADAGLPFPTTAALRLLDQAEFDPLDVLAALVADIRAHGGRVVEHARVTGVNWLGPARVTTHLGAVTAEHVVLATGYPILDRGLYFVKLKGNRSYAMAFRAPGDLPDAMYLSVDAASRSVRTTPERDGGTATGERLLLTGGNGHGVGRAASERALVEDLDRWTRRWWPGAERVAAWSAQDYETPQKVPFVGWLPRGRRRVYLATGYDKWGMTNAVACALTLTADILGGSLPWAQVLHRRLTLPQAVGWAIGENLAVGAEYAKGWTGALTRMLHIDPPEDGEGRVGRDGLLPTGVSTVDGVTCKVSAICPHKHAILNWNDFERSWDCPAHASRFAADGTLLEGPALSDLRRR